MDNISESELPKPVTTKEEIAVQNKRIKDMAYGWHDQNIYEPKKFAYVLPYDMSEERSISPSIMHDLRELVPELFVFNNAKKTSLGTALCTARSCFTRKQLSWGNTYYAFKGVKLFTNTATEEYELVTLTTIKEISSLYQKSKERPASYGFSVELEFSSPVSSKPESQHKGLKIKWSGEDVNQSSNLTRISYSDHIGNGYTLTVTGQGNEAKFVHSRINCEAQLNFDDEFVDGNTLGFRLCRSPEGEIPDLNLTLPLQVTVPFYGTSRKV